MNNIIFIIAAVVLIIITYLVICIINYKTLFRQSEKNRKDLSRQYSALENRFFSLKQEYESTMKQLQEKEKL